MERLAAMRDSRRLVGRTVVDGAFRPRTNSYDVVTANGGEVLGFDPARAGLVR